MKLSYDLSEIRQFDIALTRAGRAFNTATAKQIMREAAKPVLDAARQEVPVGKISRRNGTSRRGGTYNRGGATKRDLRIKVVAGVNGEVARVLIGVDKRAGRVGWRTHFITRRTARGLPVNDFLSRAESKAEPLVIAGFATAAQNVIARTLARYSR